MSGNTLFTGHAGPLVVGETDTIQHIADALAGLGMESVRCSDVEAAAIRVALDKAYGNRTHAAKLLGISVRTLQRKLKGDSAEKTLEVADSDDQLRGASK